MDPTPRDSPEGGDIDAPPATSGPDRTASVADDLDSMLAAQIRFLLGADALKGVERRTFVADGSRRENSAEHSWHLALMALVLAAHAAEPVDVAHVMTMVVLHDIVEVDAGDTFAYDLEGHGTKADRERAAADRIFGLLPPDQGRHLRGMWEEFEEGSTPEARFACALDRLQPMLLNHATRGAAWRGHAVTADRVLAHNRSIENGSPLLWSLARRVVDDAIGAGYLPPMP